MPTSTIYKVDIYEFDALETTTLLFLYAPSFFDLFTYFPSELPTKLSHKFRAMSAQLKWNKEYSFSLEDFSKFKVTMTQYRLINNF